MQIKLTHKIYNMPHIEIFIWSFVATLIRIAKEALSGAPIKILKAFLIMGSGVSCAHLGTPYVLSKFNLALDMESSVAFVIGLLGKEIVEVILTINLKEIANKLFKFEINNTKPVQHEPKVRKTRKKQD